MRVSHRASAPVPEGTRARCAVILRMRDGKWMREWDRWEDEKKELDESIENLKTELKVNIFPRSQFFLKFLYRYL